ncbi:MAG TPA: hypothetical protein VF777_13485 [Phycisphaerales bacterium]
MVFRICRTTEGTFRFELSERKFGLLFIGLNVDSESTAQEQILWLRQYASLEGIYQRFQPPEGGFGFTVHAAGGTLVGRSPIFPEQRDREIAIEYMRLRTRTAAPPIIVEC